MDKKTMMLLGILIIGLVIVGIIIMISSHFSGQTLQPATASGTLDTTTSTMDSSAMDSTATDTTGGDTADTTGAVDQITDVVVGTGPAAVAGDAVTVNYTGTFQDGTTFDSNLDPKFGHVQPLPFTLGAGQVIPGWDQGVTGMKVGGKRHLVIPSALAYGPAGYGPIPPNATLIFDVELLSINAK